MTTTNLRVNGEVSQCRLLAVKERSLGEPVEALVSSASAGWHGVVEDGMVGTWRELSRESLAEADLEFMTRKGPKSRGRQAVRASVVVRKRGNARGAKGPRWRKGLGRLAGGRAAGRWTRDESTEGNDPGASGQCA